MAVVAFFGATLGAILGAIFGFVLCLPIGFILRWMHLLTDEGGAWFGISVGMPLAVICAVVAFVYCFKKIFNYGGPSE